MIPRFLLPLLVSLASAAFAAPGEVWHEPAHAHPDLGGPTMRDPLYEAAENDLAIFQGFFKDGGANGNQTGGKLFYRAVPRDGSPGAWQSADLQFHADAAPNQFWKATLPASSFGATDVIQYYIRVDFDGTAGSPPPETTYLHGGDLPGHSDATTDEAAARADPYSLRDRPGWIFHAGNRTQAGDDLQMRVKTGYIGPGNDPATLWATDGAVYYTTDGSEPGGSLGSPATGASAVPLAFDGTQRDLSGNGNAAWWSAALEGVLDGLALGEQVRYKIGLWNSATNEEKFADHAAAEGDATFVYQNGRLGEPILTVNGTNANYTTTKLFVDEIAGDEREVRVEFQPGDPDVVDAEVFTNLNRRNRADDDANGDGYDDGIVPVDGNSIAADDNGHYYAAHDMTRTGPGTYALTLQARKTGAYRLTARWKVEGDPDWRWYTDRAANRRDHAITVSPVDARDITLYEINVHNIEATGDTFAERSTIEDMHNAPGAPHNGNNRWDLDYLKGLGANWLWFQPVHPPARDGREPSGGFGTDTPPYEPGSPYAVKNFFRISPIMTKDFTGSHTNNDDLLDPDNRAKAMQAWQDFVAAADAKDVGIMLDAPFNHTGFDVELAQAGVELFEPDGADWSATDEIREREARFFSKEGAYDERASSAAGIAPAPDRFDFGKWRDVKDVFFGVYDALVEEDQEPERSSFTNEGDWFDRTDDDWTARDFVQNGEPRNVTKQVWKYFARYATHWIGKTRPDGQNRNSATEPGLTQAERYAWAERGIDGLRCDFGQGLPPRAWEYIINVARERKWNFVMMSESLDGGAVTYRSNRHFDILNENIVFPLKAAETDDAYQSLFERRRDLYGQAPVLINNMSHDEESYVDPWEALIRFSVGATMDGAPMIFPGQELGISRTFGYEHYELNFGKEIAHFKRFNSMAPIWNDADFGNDQLYPVYAGIGKARRQSPALRSPNRWFMDGDGGNDKIHAVAKYERAGASPAARDAVLAFANLDRDNPQSDAFTLPAELASRLGIEDNRLYNVKNIAAYLGQESGRRDAWLWGDGLTGAELKNQGFFVQLNEVPATSDDPGTPEVNEAAQAWADAPFEAQYLKIHDVTPPPATAAPANDKTRRGAPADYAIGDQATFAWAPSPDNTEDDAIAGYRIVVRDGDGTIVAERELGNVTEYTVTAAAGRSLTATVTPISRAGVEGGASPPSEPVQLLSADGDADGDGRSNAAEDSARTDPFDPGSALRVLSAGPDANDRFTLEWPTVPGVDYSVDTREQLRDDGDPNTAQDTWTPAASGIPGDGALRRWTDPEAIDAPPDGRKFYRIRVE